MATFEHCLHCKPPVRHPGCHSGCPHYQAYAADHRAEMAKKDAAYRVEEDYLAARGFKTRRGKDMRRTKR